MVSAQVTGDKEIGEEMVKMAEILGRDVTQIVPIAAKVCARAGRDISKPGQIYRDIIQRKLPPRKKEISKRTDTSRTSTHWVVFRRQGKKPFFVPVNPNPHGGDYDDPDNTREVKDYAKNDSYRKRKGKTSTPSVYKYQQTRTSTTKRGKRGNILEYDTPQEIMSMRKIGRRGLAAESWAWMGNQVPRSGSAIGLKGRDMGTKWNRNSKANPDAREKQKAQVDRHVKKWTRVSGVLAKDNATVSLDNRLTYIQRAFPGMQSRLIGLTAEKLVGDAKRRVKAAEARANRKTKARAA